MFLFLDRHIVTARDLATAQLAAGDSVMSRLWDYVNSDDGRIDEQVDKNTGVQTSAQGLTWSYANILHALKIRFENFE
jgi:GH15 family glucan-1,4-alpha-glucosidase